MGAKSGFRWLQCWLIAPSCCFQSEERFLSRSVPRHYRSWPERSYSELTRTTADAHSTSFCPPGRPLCCLRCGAAWSYYRTATHTRRHANHSNRTIHPSWDRSVRRISCHCRPYFADLRPTNAQTPSSPRQPGVGSLAVIAFCFCHLDANRHYRADHPHLIAHFFQTFCLFLF